jgi:hypothetical protein
MQQTSTNLITQQAIAFLNQIEGKLDDAATIAQLQSINAELIQFSTTAGFAHLPTELLQRWDALHDQVAEIGESALTEFADRIGLERSDVDLHVQFDQRRSISHVDIKTIAAEYVKKLDYADTLEYQAQCYISTASQVEDAAFRCYENAFEQNITEEEWDLTVLSAKAELHQKRMEELVTLAVKTLNSEEADEVRWNSQVITFIRDENRLMIVDEEHHAAINANWSGEEWDYQAFNFSKAVFLTFKRSIETHLNQKNRTNEANQQSELQEVLELG